MLPFLAATTIDVSRSLQRLANNFGAVNATVPTFLNVVDLAHRLVGPKPLEYLSTLINKASGNYIPQWNKYMPRVSNAVNIPVPPGAEWQTFSVCGVGSNLRRPLSLFGAFFLS